MEQKLRQIILNYKKAIDQVCDQTSGRLPTNGENYDDLHTHIENDTLEPQCLAAMIHGY